MTALRRAWTGLFGFGIGLLTVDVLSGFLLAVNGIPVFGLLGVALMMLVLTSWLNWQFQVARDERTAKQLYSGHGPSD